MREHPIRSGHHHCSRKPYDFVHLPWSKLAVVNFTSPKAEKKGLFVVICGAVVKMSWAKFVKILSYIIIHTVAFACFYHIYVYNLYMYISYHSAHIFQYAQDLSIMVLRRSSERTYLPSCSINLGSMPWLQQLGGDHDLQNVMSLVV